MRQLSKYLGIIHKSNADGDVYGDTCDNCPTVPNSDQTDIDNDQVEMHVIIVRLFPIYFKPM